MTAEATLLADRHEMQKLLDAAAAGGEVHQLPDGRGGYKAGLRAADAGERAAFVSTGQVWVPKASGVVLLAGGRAFWDHSANRATYKPVNDRDFFLGAVVEDAAATAARVLVNLNVEPFYLLDLARDAYTTIPVGTQAAGGFGPPRREGGALALVLTATNEAQKADALSVDGFATGARAIVELAFRIPVGGSGGASDFTIGVANETHATNADSIANSVFLHLDGGSANIYAESDDGGAGEVAATDTTIDFSAGVTFDKRVEAWIDMRDPADVKFYVDGARVLPNTVFSVAAVTNVWKLLVHLEKTSGTETADMTIDWLRARIQQ